MPQFPMFRLVTLLARQISEPIARRIKEYALTHPLFKQRVVIATGRLYHVAELRSKMWSLALRQPRAVQALAEKRALDSGATLLGEIIVFSVASVTIILEVNRQAKNQEDKVMDEVSQRLATLMQLEELQRELVLQQQDIDRLVTHLRSIAPNEFPPGSPPDGSKQPSDSPEPPREPPKTPYEVPKQPCTVPKPDCAVPTILENPTEMPNILFRA